LQDVQMVTRPAEGARARDLLERDRAFGILEDAVRDARTRWGRFVLVRGEAGTGKTEVVRRFCEAQRSSSTRVLWGSCEALFAPRPLGPLVEIADETGGELQTVMQSDGKPHEVTAALEQELASRFTILVLDDLHWADEATLDVVRLLTRRIERLELLVVAMLRDEQLEPSHPLRLVLGELATDRKVERIVLEPLSAQAVAELAAPWNVDAADLFRKTGGNPFYVVEALLAYDEPIPATVRDAVLARVARLSPTAQRLLELVAVAQPETELWLVEQGATLADLEECVSSSMLAATPNAVRFRHELARLAVESSITPVRAIELHRTVLSALQAPGRETADLSRLAHHAEGAGDRDAVLRLAPAAAQRAASLGAHREAAAQYARALRFADELSVDRRAGLLTLHSFECYLTTQDTQALESIDRALECYRRIGDEAQLGAMLRWQSLLLMNVARQPEAERAAREAASVLERQPHGHELAMAYCTLGAFASLDEDADFARSFAARGHDLANQAGSVEGRMAALGTLGLCDVMQGAASGWERFDEAFALGREEGLDVQTGRAYVLYGMAASRERSLPRMERAIPHAIEFCEERDLEMWGRILLAMRAWLELEQGAWDACAATTAQVLAHNCTLSALQANIVRGLLRARRGDPDPWSPLEAAAEVAERTQQLWWTCQVAGAMAEAAWLTGRPELIDELTVAPFVAATERQASWPLAELAYWRRQAGIELEAPTNARGPYAAQVRGEWTAAAEQWADAGCPYEAAVALSEGPDNAQRQALEELNRLGARPAARIVARRLRQRGIRALARGPRAGTRESPAGLTRRETEVLMLLGEGLRNAEIAGRLVLSRRTIDHHVSAILQKLGARSRGEAVATARRLGLVDDR